MVEVQADAHADEQMTAQVAISADLEMPEEESKEVKKSRKKKKKTTKQREEMPEPVKLAVEDMKRRSLSRQSH